MDEREANYVAEPDAAPITPLRPRRRRTSAGALRFHLVLNASYAAVAVAILKMEGPFFADAIAAGLFVCGFWLALFSFRSVRAAEKDLPRDARTRGIRPVLIAFATFHLAAATATVWLSYVNPVEETQPEGVLAGMCSPDNERGASWPLPGRAYSALDL